MDEKTIGRAALVTVRRAICERFAPVPERDAWLRWAAGFGEIWPTPLTTRTTIGNVPVAVGVPANTPAEVTGLSG